jgi:anti-sigma regulatory factor (Ser/Thr protein kinase)
MWSFDPTNKYYAKQLRDEYVSILYACGTAASDFFAAEVIYGELIANAYRHAPGRVSVELHWFDPNPILHVHDQGKLFLWTGEMPADPLVERGRGLYLVKSLALGLRVKDYIGSGFKISAVLPVERKCDLADLFEFAELQA